MTDDDPKLMGLDSAHYAAVGRVAASWAYLELTLDGAIHDWASLDEDLGTCITSQISGTSRKRDALVALIRLKQPTDQELRPLLKTLDAIIAVSERRNRIVHDPWVMRGKDDGEFVSVKLPFIGTEMKVPKNRGPHRLEATARKKLILGFVPVETEQVEAVRLEIERCQSVFFDQNRKLSVVLRQREADALLEKAQK